MKKLVAVSAALMVGAIAVPASAQTDLSPFGVKGTLAISAQGGTQLFAPDGSTQQVGLTPFIGWEFRKQSDATRPNGSQTTHKQNGFFLNPGVDYFIIDNLSIGGEVLFAVTGSSQTDKAANGAETTRTLADGTHWGIMPRVGYNFALSSLFSFWPRAGFGYRSASFSNIPGSNDLSFSSFLFFVDAYFLLHPVEHFFVGAGPGVTFTVSNRQTSGGVSQDGPTITNFRILSFTIGGYF